MKKIIVIIAGLLFVNLISANEIEKISIDAIIYDNGTLHIQEVWNVDTDEKTEFYIPRVNMGNMRIENFTVKDEKNEYLFESDWDIKGSFESKKNKYGINYIKEGLELCWGISEYGNKTYTINYDLVNAVFDTSDAQVLFVKLVNDSEHANYDFEIKIRSNKYFEDTLDVWGYGYKGYAYVENGIIQLSNEENTKVNENGYIDILVKFPLNTFNVNNSYSEYKTFEDVLDVASEGAFEYDYDDDNLGDFITFLIEIFFVILAIVAVRNKSKYKFGKLGKKIKMSEINYFRDIPCNKDIYRAYFISQAYGLAKKKTDFFGSIFLKWVYEDKVKLLTEDKKNIFGKNKKETSIELKNEVEFDVEIEYGLYNFIKSASGDNILEQNELSKYSSKNYKTLLDWFPKAENFGRQQYENESVVNKKGTKYYINDSLKEEAIKLAGLKKYLIEFSRIKEKEVIEVKLWKEYLMFAQIFGIADKVAEQFEKLYPEVLEQMHSSNIDIHDIIILNSFSNNAVVNASSARVSAENYKSGGGGFSFGGGGGGFGGGMSSGSR